LERRRKSTAPQPRGGLNQDAATNAPTSGLPDLPYIEETIEQGGISIGIIPPLTECVAVAHTDDIFTDEINPPAKSQRP
jgi:hypothetical protein